MTVNTPATAQTTAAAAPAATAACTCALAKNPGPNTAVYSSCTPSAPGRWPRQGRGLSGRAGHDQEAAVDVQYVDVVTVQPGEHLTGDHLPGGAAGRPAAGDVDDPVHHRQQRV